MLSRPRFTFALLGLAVAVAGACGGSAKQYDDDDDNGGSGGSAGHTSTPSSGHGTGASSGNQGGAQGSGASSTGGNSEGGEGLLGGTPGSGGSDASGGTDSPAGGTKSSGGTKSTGGTSTGATGAGGDTSSGGDAGAGANAAGGTSGSGAGGSGGSQTTGVCGDGKVDAGETCDDGNTKSGDGCARDCTIEQGFTCSNATCDGGHCALHVPATFRDFNASTATGGHPDFQPGFNSAGAIQGLVKPDLDADGKPVLSSTATSSASGGFMHGQAQFAQWYRDGAPSGGPIPGELVLWDDGSGQGRYVNRFGANGEQWQGDPTEADYGLVTYGGPSGEGCPLCTPTATGKCYDPCTPWGYEDESCCAEIPPAGGYDGNPLFFPIDTGSHLLTELRSEGKVPSQYGWYGWPWEHMVATSLGITTPEPTAYGPFPSTAHNFSFTTEVTFSFRYDAGGLYRFEIGGDDDIWVFINGHLVIDLGGWHVPLDGSATMSGGLLQAEAALTVDDTGHALKVANTEIPTDDLGLEDGKIYAVSIFNAERQVEGSSFKFAVTGTDATKSICTPTP